MIQLKTAMPKSVYEQLLQGKEVIANNSTSEFNRGGIFDFITEITGYKTFFFGMEVGSTTEDNLEYLCHASGKDNEVLVELEIPKEECFRTDYYEYSDLLYFLEFGDDPQTIDIIKDILRSGQIRENSEVQILYPVLKPEYVKQQSLKI